MTERREQQASKGSVVTELAVCMLFLPIILTSVVDISMLLQEYASMTQAAYAGLRAANSVANLEEGQYQSLKDTSYCPLETSSTAHEALQLKMRDLVESLAEADKKIDASTLCVRTGLRKSGGALPEAPMAYTVYVILQVDYDGFFFHGIRINVKRTGPYLSKG